MTDLTNYREILDEAQDIAKNIATDYDLETFSLDQAIHEICDGHRFVIYTSDAFQLVATTRYYDHQTFNDAELYVRDMVSDNASLSDVMITMAFLIMQELVVKQYSLLQEAA